MLHRLILSGLRQSNQSNKASETHSKPESNRDSQRPPPCAIGSLFQPGVCKTCKRGNRCHCQSDAKDHVPWICEGVPRIQQCFCNQMRMTLAVNHSIPDQTCQCHYKTCEGYQEPTL